MPIRDKIKNKLKETLKDTLKDTVQPRVDEARKRVEDVRSKVLEKYPVLDSPHKKWTTHVPDVVQDSADPSAPAGEYYNFGVIVGTELGPDGITEGAYAIANGKSGDVHRWPLPNDPKHKDAKFFANGDAGILKSIGVASKILEIPGSGIWHFRKENVMDMKPAKTRNLPLKKESSLKLHAKAYRYTSPTSRHQAPSHHQASIILRAGKKTLERLLTANPGFENELRQLSEGDPTNNDGWLEWMFKQVKAGFAVPRVIKAVDDFDRYTTVLKDQKRPANPFGYKTLDELEGIVTELRKSKVTPRLRKKDAKYDIVYEDKEWTIYDVHNKEASCTLGADSDWCSTKWQNDWYERRKQQYGGKQYIARSKTDKKVGYMLRVKNGAILTAYNLRDDNVLGSRQDDDYQWVVDKLMELNLADSIDDNERIPDEDEAEDEYITVYYVRHNGEQQRLATNFNSEDLTEVREWAENDDDCLDNGYTIYSRDMMRGQYENDGIYYDSDDFEVESYEPQTQEYFVVCAGLEPDDSAKDPNFEHAIEGFENEEEAKEYVFEYADELKPIGYTIWKIMIPEHHISRRELKDLEVEDGTSSLIASSEPDEDATKNRDSMHVAVQMQDGRLHVLKHAYELSDLEPNADNAELKYGGYDIYEVQDNAATLARINFGITPATILDVQKNGKLVKSVPDKLTTRLLVMVDSDPVAMFADNERGLANAQENLQEFATDRGELAQIVRVQVPERIAGAEALLRGLTPTDLKRAAIKMTVVEQRDLKGTEQGQLPIVQHNNKPQGLTVTQLRALPIGAVVTEVNARRYQTVFNGGYKYTKINANKWGLARLNGDDTILGTKTTEELPKNLIVDMSDAKFIPEIGQALTSEELSKLPAGAIVEAPGQFGGREKYTKTSDGLWYNGMVHAYGGVLQDAKYLGQTNVMQQPLNFKEPELESWEKPRAPSDEARLIQNLNAMAPGSTVETYYNEDGVEKRTTHTKLENGRWQSSNSGRENEASTLAYEDLRNWRPATKTASIRLRATVESPAEARYRVLWQAVKALPGVPSDDMGLWPTWANGTTALLPAPDSEDFKAFVTELEPRAFEAYLDTLETNMRGGLQKRNASVTLLARL